VQSKSTLARTEDSLYPAVKFTRLLNFTSMSRVRLDPQAGTRQSPLEKDICRDHGIILVDDSKKQRDVERGQFLLEIGEARA